MRIKWDPVEKCWQAELQDFRGDLDAVKNAGFKTTGPPDWIWFTWKVSVLDKLREKHRPGSGLTITADAFAEYDRQRAIEETNKALKDELKAKKQALERAQAAAEPTIEPEAFESEAEAAKILGTGYAGPAGWTPPLFTGPRCHICAGPVYFYEIQEPPTCLWCEKQMDTIPIGEVL